MPIYAYRCDACGFAKDVLQKMSDPVLTVCLSCGQPSFKKQVTAAGFQLKGTGWYATDFRGGTAPSTGTATGPVDGASAGVTPAATPANGTAATPAVSSAGSSAATPSSAVPASTAPKAN